jgi:PIN domain nuclease of toxin-antitoxin system
MIYLIDTHILIWALFNRSKLSANTIEILSNPINSIFVSSVDFWEISIKFRTGKIDLGKYGPDQLPNKCLEMGFEIIDLNINETSTFHQLTADYHKDPFDRMLIWQAIKNNYTLVSDDENVQKYVSEGLKVVS